MGSKAAFVLPKAIFNPSLYARIRSVWFPDLPASATAPNYEATKRWFGVGSDSEKANFDGVCRSHFITALDAVGPISYTLPSFQSSDTDRKEAASIAAPFISEIYSSQFSDEQKAETALSLTILLDQMSRNVFRANQSLIYTHYDRISLALLRYIVSQSPRLDLHSAYRLHPVFRLWFYMPFMHSEDLADHAEYDKLVRSMRQEVEETGDKGACEYTDTSLDFEKKHAVILEKFGRYPHRNEVLGRTTTEEEKAWMEAGGDTFGTKS